MQFKESQKFPSVYIFWKHPFIEMQYRNTSRLIISRFYILQTNVCKTTEYQQVHAFKLDTRI